MIIFQKILILLIKLIKNYNLFQSIPPSTDEHDLQNERISTRLYIILLSLSFIILLLYHSLIPIIKTDIKTDPTYDEYQYLYSLYPNTLTCPCKHILIDYKDILEINYTLHEICSSDFMKEQWFQYLIDSYDKNKIHEYDFRWTGSFTFQALNGLCELIDKTILDSYLQFQSKQYISTSIISLDAFDKQIQNFINEFRLTTTRNFLRSFQMIRIITSINSFYSERSTNYRLKIRLLTSQIELIGAMYGKCNCQFSSKCLSPTSFYKHPDTKPLFTIKGLYQGCYIIDALLQSNLECFYNKTCLSQIQLQVNSSLTMNLTVLQRTNQSHYQINSTIEQFLDNFMIEEWNSSYKYPNYYKQCQPIECIYSYKTKNEKISIVVATIGLIGGLITILKIVVPILIKFIRRKKQLTNPTNGE